MICPQCGRENSDTATLCVGCGAEIGGANQAAAAAAPMAPAPAPAPAATRTDQYEAFVGPKNTEYYVSRFLRFDREGVGMSWHWPAFFVTFYWLLYRKMWLAALLYFFVPSILYIPYSAAVDHFLASSDAVRGIAYLGWVGAIFLLPPMFANAVYYRHANKKIAAVVASTPGTERQLGELSAKGGTSHIAAIVIALLVFVAMLGVVAAIAIPAYQSYTIKAKVAQAAGVGQIAAESVAGYYYQNGKMPETLEATTFSAPLPASVKSISLDPNDGTVSMKLNAGIPGVDNGMLMMVPSFDENQKIIWACSNQEIEDKYLPKQCQSAD